MKLKSFYIGHLTMTALLLLLAVVNAAAQWTVYQGTITPLTVVQHPGDTYAWELYSDPSVNFATVPGNCPASAARFTGGNTGASVNVEWLVPGIYFYKVTAWNASGCTNNLKIGMIKVIPYDVQAIIAGSNEAGYCQHITLDGSTSRGEPVKYEWAVLDPGVILTSQTTANTQLLISPAFTGTLPADFRVRLQVTNKEGVTDSDTVSVRFNALPLADVTSGDEPEKDGSLLVDGTVSKGIGLHYKWSSSQGKIVGPTDQPHANLLGAGRYTLEVIDAFGCKAMKTFMFPLEKYKITANPDHARTSWAMDTTIYILNNDRSTVRLIPGSVRVITPPEHGQIRINPDGSVVYTPTERKPGRDRFVYEVCDAVNLCDSAIVTIDVTDSGVQIIEGFSPNGDGQNDYMVFKGLEHYPLSHLHVYTRSGQLVYRSLDYLNDWDGRTLQSTGTKVERLPTGTYYYVLELGGTSRVIKGFVYIGY